MSGKTDLIIKIGLGIINGMAKDALKQIKILKSELRSLDRYSSDDLEKHKDKIKEIESIISEIKKIIDDEN